MKHSTYIYLIIFVIFATQSFGMRRITKWPPLLWCTYEHPRAFVKQLQQHNISVADYLKSQVDNAQTKALDAVQEEWQLADKDIERTKKNYQSGKII